MERTVETGNLTSRDGTRLSYVLSPHPAARAVLLFVPGYADHVGRYSHVFDWFVSRGYTCTGIDLRGHGRSGGHRGFVEHFGAYVDDLETAVNLLVERYPDQKLVLVGHSMGGLVVLTYLLRHPEGIEGAVLSSPFLGLALEVPKIKELLGRVMSRLWPTLGLPSGLSGRDLTHDMGFAEAYDADPLVFKNATARWFTEAMRAQGELLRYAGQIQTPTLMLQAGADKVVDAETSRQVYELISATDKEWRSYDDLYHELFNEVEREQPLQDVVDWLGKHV